MLLRRSGPHRRTRGDSESGIRETLTIDRFTSIIDAFVSIVDLEA